MVASKLDPGCAIHQIGEELFKTTGVEAIIITRSEKGITLLENNLNRKDFPVRNQEIKDVTGAGDTVLAVIAMIYASGLSLYDGLELANIAAGIAIERIGCARVSLPEIAERLLENSISNKIFEEKYLFVLEQALKDKALTILGLNSKDGVSSNLFLHIKKVSRECNNECLMIYLIDMDPDENFISLLTSIHEVNFIVIQSDSLASLCKKVQPSQAYILENERIISIDHTAMLLI